MTKEEFLAKVTEIGTCEDLVEVRTKLTDLSDSVSDIFDTSESLTVSNNSLKEENESLRSANMKLFLKIGDTNKKPEDEAPEPKEKRSFDNLFNEKGELK